jgi:hypothetical protein
MCTYVVALACSILGSGIGGDGNKLLSNIPSEDVEIKEVYLCVYLLRTVCCTEFFETKFELENVTKRSYVNKQMCEV